MATSTTTNVYLEQRAAGVTALLDSLSTVLRTGRAADLAALLDPSATAEFRASLQTVQDNLSAAAYTPDAQTQRRGTRLQLKDFRYQLAPTEEAETLVSADVAARLNEQGSTDTWVAPVQIRAALGGETLPGVDEKDVLLNTQLVAARYEDSWKLVGDASLVGEPVPPAQLWDRAGLAATDVATSGGTSVIASYPEGADVVDRVRKLLPGAVNSVSAFWGRDWAQRAVVVATSTDEQFQALAGSATDTAAAATVYATDDPATHTVTGQRVILTPAAREIPEPALGVVLRHELTHVATRAQTTSSAPMWLTEGVAEYVGRKGTYTRPSDAAPDLAAAVRAGQTPTDVPTSEQFSLTSDASRLAYQSAWSVAAYVASTFGESTLKTLYIRLGAGGDTARQDAEIMSALSITRVQLVQRWRAWLIKELQ